VVDRVVQRVAGLQRQLTQRVAVEVDDPFGRRDEPSGEGAERIGVVQRDRFLPVRGIHISSMSPESESEPLVTPASPSPSGGGAPRGGKGRRGRRGRDSDNMLPQRERSRSAPERLLVRLVATAGIVGIGVAIAAIMVSSNDQGWEVGLVVSIVSVVLAAVLWSSRVL
jgi:hypothetical protein